MQKISQNQKITNFQGIKSWFLEDLLHRTDGPARIYPDGAKEWWMNNQLHRTNGPAIEYSDGDKTWYQYGKLHRTDGPAIEHANGRKEWYLNGKRIPEDLLPWYIATIVIDNLTVPANSKS